MRTCVVAAFLLVAAPIAALAQHKTTAPGGTPNQLTTEEFERLMVKAPR